MNLSTLTAPLRQDYDFLQAQIETIQLRQQQILAGIQQIEDKVEAANLALSEAIAAVREYCPEQLGEYQQAVNELFETETVAQIEAFVEPAPEPEEMVEVATITIDGMTVSVESLEDDGLTGEYGVEEIEEEAEHESTFAGFSEETIEEVADDGNNGRVYLTADELSDLSIGKVRSLAAKYYVSAKGKRYEIAARLKGMVTQDDLAELD